MADNFVPSTSAVLFPDLMSRDELTAVLKVKFHRMGVKVLRLDKLSHDELLRQFKKYVMPKPQRKAPNFYCSTINRTGNRTNANDLRKMSLTKLQNSQMKQNKADFINGQKLCNRKQIAGCTENYRDVKKARKHSPVRFP
ncbi:unnamed protein product [Thelazia callipaeda]|uniref:Ashwin n=1 Tax=Thelazia callipaeda TaxID=103827 RepID=A0A0N5CZU7_THECL|nr:unnamed protein product [Thelazia callipaeda]